MYQIDVLLEGVAPFLFNRMTEAEQEKINTGQSGGNISLADKEAGALLKAYRDDAGLYWPAWNVKRCLCFGIDRAKLKEGRGSLRPYVEATVFPDDPARFVLPDGSPKLDVDLMHRVMGKVPPRTGGAQTIRRPMLNTGWRLACVLRVVDDRRRPDDLRRALDEAGLLVGMGSWRPQYGRFVVVGWDVQASE